MGIQKYSLFFRCWIRATERDRFAPIRFPCVWTKIGKERLQRIHHNQPRRNSNQIFCTWIHGQTSFESTSRYKLFPSEIWWISAGFVGQLFEFTRGWLMRRIKFFKRIYFFLKTKQIQKYETFIFSKRN